MDKSFHNKYIELERNNWWFRVRRSIVHDLLQDFFPKSSQPRILDFGCSSGSLVHYLSDLGFRAEGVDISEEAISRGKEAYNIDLSILKNNHLDFPDNTFDCVLSLDVLEHLEDEGWAINEISRVLKSDGIFIVFVPAFQFLWGQQDVVSHHYRRYNYSTLVSTIKKSADFKILKKSYFNFLLFPPIAVIRLLSRLLKKKRGGSDFDSGGNTFLDPIFFKIFNFERGILRRFSIPFGVSLMLVLRKNGNEKI